MAAKTASLSVNIIADAAKARAGLKEAETAFGKFRREVGEAQGAMGKFQAVGNNVFSAIKANAMNFAAAGAAAIGTFAVKSVMAFQDLALEVGKFSDATGLSTDEASRFIEVAGDIGVEAGVVEKAIGFMNKTLGNSPDLFKQLGVQIEYTSGGAADINATFLNVVERLNQIKDPAQRAAAATKLLGRGWMELSELVGMGADQLASSLSSVSDAKVIDPDEVERARNFRASMDELKDSLEDVSITVGQSVVPALSNFASTLAKVIEKGKDIPGVSFALDNIWKVGFGGVGLALEGARQLGQWIGILGDETKQTYPVTDELARAWRDGYRAMIDARPPAQNLNSEIERQQQVLEDAKYAWDLFKGNLTMELERQNIVSDIEEFRQKWAGSTDEAKRKSQEYRNELLRLQIQVANFGGETIRTASIATQNRIRVLVETGQLERAVQLLQYIRNNTLGYVSTPRTTYAVTPYGAMPGYADGGIVMKPQISMVGEAGPEVVIPLTKPDRAQELMQRTGLSQIPMNSNRQSAPTVINISVQAGLVSSPDQVGAQIIDAIKRAERRSGQVFASV